MAKKGYREESDSIGIVYVPRKALYGAQTQRAIDNFPISGIKMDFPFTKSFVSSLGVIKDAAARANNKLNPKPFAPIKAEITAIEKHTMITWFTPIKISLLAVGINTLNIN